LDQISSGNKNEKNENERIEEKMIELEMINIQLKEELLEVNFKNDERIIKFEADLEVFLYICIYFMCL
jgi:hypothetical protein